MLIVFTRPASTCKLPQATAYRWSYPCSITSSPQPNPFKQKLISVAVFLHSSLILAILFKAGTINLHGHGKSSVKHPIKKKSSTRITISPMFIPTRPASWAVSEKVDVNDHANKSECESTVTLQYKQPTGKLTLAARSSGVFIFLCCKMYRTFRDN